MALNALYLNRRIPPECESSKYDLHFRGQRFPPKYVVRLAYSFLSPSGEILASFKGPKMARDFLRSRGFQVFTKTGNVETE